MMPKFNDFVAFSLVLVFILEGGRRGVQFFILPMVSGCTVTYDPAFLSWNTATTVGYYCNSDLPPPLPTPPLPSPPHSGE